MLFPSDITSVLGCVNYIVNQEFYTSFMIVIEITMDCVSLNDLTFREYVEQ